MMLKGRLRSAEHNTHLRRPVIPRLRRRLVKLPPFSFNDRKNR